MKKHNDYEQIYDQLLVLSKIMNQHLDCFAKQSGYTATEFIIIRYVLDHPKTTQQKIIEAVHMNKSTASKTIKGLIAKGDIRKTQCSKDQRESELEVLDPQTKQCFDKQNFIKRVFGDADINEDTLKALNLHLEALLAVIQ